MKQFSNKSVDMSLRVASLDYLGIVASRLRKDAVSSQDNQGSIDEIITKVQGVLFVLFCHSEANGSVYVQYIIPVNSTVYWLMNVECTLWLIR